MSVKKSVIIVTSLILTVLLVVAVIIMKNKNEEKVKEENYESVISAIEKMDLNFQIAKKISATVSSTWSDNLGNDFSSKVNGVIKSYKGFKTYNEYEKNSEEITNQSRSIIKSNMDKDLKKRFTVLIESYTEYTNLAVDPKGNLGSYNARTGELENSFTSNYQNLKIYVPDKYIEKIEKQEKANLVKASSFNSSDYYTDYKDIDYGNDYSQASSDFTEESNYEHASNSNIEDTTESNIIVSGPEDATKLASDTYGDGGNIVFSLFGEGLETDEYGNYYLVAGSSLRAIEGGGNGTAGRYRVYEDGTIIEGFSSSDD